MTLGSTETSHKFMTLSLYIYIYTHTHTNTHTLLKKQPLETWMKLEDFTLSEVKPVTKRQILFVF